MCGIFLYYDWHDADVGRNGMPDACGEVALGGMDGQILYRDWIIV
jgi:hypothetical protein